MKIIIVGCGKLGQKLAQQLSKEKCEVTVIDMKNQAVQETMEKCDIAGVNGNGASETTLVEAGVNKVEILIATTGSDELNMLCCLVAKKLSGCQTIARVRNPEYNKVINTIKDDLGLALTINPEHTAANEIARILKFPQTIKIDTFAKGRVEIMKFRVPESSVLSNMGVSDIVDKLKCQVLVCAVERGDEVFIPGGDFVIKARDVLSVVASGKNAMRFFTNAKIASGRVKNTIIIGGGAIGYYLAEILLQSGIGVKIIDNNFATCENLSTRLPKAEIILGDATDRNVINEAGIEKADSVVCATGVDEENIMLSLYVKSQSKAKIITKINRIPFDEVINGLDLDTIIRPKNIAAEFITRFVRAKKNSVGSNVETMHSIIEGKAEALEFIIRRKSAITGVPLENLNFINNILIACINRNGKIITPMGRDTIEVGDTVVVITKDTGLDDITDILA